MVGLVGQEKRGGGHGVEELHDLRACRAAQAFEVCPDVVDNSQERGVDGRQLPLARRNQVVY